MQRRLSTAHVKIMERQDLNVVRLSHRGRSVLWCETRIISKVRKPICRPVSVERRRVISECPGSRRVVHEGSQSSAHWISISSLAVCWRRRLISIISSESEVGSKPAFARTVGQVTPRVTPRTVCTSVHVTPMTQTSVTRLPRDPRSHRAQRLPEDKGGRATPKYFVTLITNYFCPNFTFQNDLLGNHQTMGEREQNYDKNTLGVQWHNNNYHTHTRAHTYTPMMCVLGSVQCSRRISVVLLLAVGVFYSREMLSVSMYN